MAARNSKENPLGSPLVHIKMCEIHEKTIDMIYEDCDEFICVGCALTDDREHDPKTLATAATQRKRDLPKFMKKIKEENLSVIAEKIDKILQQITENKQLCDSEIKKLQKHYDEIIARLTEIRKRHEQTVRDDLVKKNDQLNHVKSELDKKKRGIIDMVEFMEENNSTMSDYSLIDNYRELTRMLSELEVHTTNCEHSVKFTRGDINNNLLESLVGRTVDLNDIAGSQSVRSSVHLRSLVQSISSLSFTDDINKTISCLSPSRSVSTVISTDPLEPNGICQSMDGGLLVTLRDMESRDYILDSQS
ncbi:uncharacterized protein LOC133174801 [Saccostrea echinata]|uniref:uncharacterized protein LOC133174801 n=1 Tax=Saccostrea echinata TaxID=191078 RepID=UPI002A7FAEC6|nr:uncharacterized protein LOC133174801 [Saccostrea echinata]